MDTKSFCYRQAVTVPVRIVIQSVPPAHFAVVPISIVKNGFRIAFLSTMAIYVNPSFLTGPLHHRGGIVFYILALIPLFLLLKFLQNRENKSPALVSPNGGTESGKSRNGSRSEARRVAFRTK